jgi:hypothetical protein
MKKNTLMVIELDTSQLGEVLPPNDHNRGGE